MYFHLDSNGFKMGMVGVCTCDTVAGDYTFVDGFQPDGQRSLDMGLFQDTDGSAYLVRSVDNKYAGFSKLTPDYLRPTGIFSHGPKCEGQAVWRDGDDYYLLGSHLTGWSANPAILSLGQSSEASIEIGIARSSVSVSASAQGSGIFRHLGRFSAFFRLFWGILDPTDSD